MGRDGYEQVVGRERELAALEFWLSASGQPPVALVHGPGGIGKSSIVRVLTDRARARRLDVIVFDGRDADTIVDPLQTALANQHCEQLVVLDSAERAPAFASLVRELIAPEGAVKVLLAGREPPGREWAADGWEDGIRAFEIGPLEADAARALVEGRGLEAPGAVDQVVQFAGGSPLALMFAADAVTSGQAIALESLDPDALLGGALLDGGIGADGTRNDPDVIAVAGIARAVDARMLAAVLPGTDGDRAEASLRELRFSERLGTRVTLHERVRKAVHATLLAEEPSREHELRRRIADHVHARMMLGERWLSLDLTELIADDILRWGLSTPPVSYYPSRPADGDAELLARKLGGVGTQWWAGMERWFLEAPEQVCLIRRADHEIATVGVWVTPATAPALAAEDVVLGPWLEYAAAHDHGQDVVMLREGFDLDGPGDGPSEAISAGNHFMIQRSGVANMRYAYAGVRAHDDFPRRFLMSMGYEFHPELSAIDGERRIDCAIRDFGPAGIQGFLREAVYHDLGLPPPESDDATGIAVETVRDALRCFHQPSRLAASPLARGGPVDQRAESVRRLIRDSVEATFGHTAAERLQHNMIVRGYLDPDGGHDRAVLELHVSRTTYFRTLGRASTRVAEHVLGSLS